MTGLEVKIALTTLNIPNVSKKADSIRGPGCILLFPRKEEAGAF
jgi:hypothetical protein